MTWHKYTMQKGKKFSEEFKAILIFTLNVMQLCEHFTHKKNHDGVDK